MELLATHNSQLTTFLLADFERGIGFVVFAAIAGVMWVVGAIAKAAQEKQQREKFRNEHGKLDQPLPASRQMPAHQQRTQPKQKNRNKRPPPVPVDSILPRSYPAAAEVAAPLETARRNTKSDIGRNVRLMLTKSGAREAIIINELLGKPKGLD
ncbi:MAG TPA: hypothetical protein PK402_04325 [Tepidisphaeraceae bacterium]|nr:hypothetical protein [Tepidisphaeraceae bacterium]